MIFHHSYIDNSFIKFIVDQHYLTKNHETYIDENGHERDKQKKITIPSFGEVDVNKIKSIAENVCKEIKKLNKETTFSIQQFIDNYEVEYMDKYPLCNFILDYCKKENIIIVVKDSNEVSKLPWDMSRIKKN